MFICEQITEELNVNFVSAVEELIEQSDDCDLFCVAASLY